jgi:hypothetical protein
MSDEDDVRDKDYGVDGNEYYYNGDSDDTRLGHGQPDTKEHDIIEILTSPVHGLLIRIKRLGTKWFCTMALQL